MPIRDDFPYLARWDSVGIDCSSCTHERTPSRWPVPRGEDHCCGLHGVPLACVLGPDRRKTGEWFCRDYRRTDAGGIARTAAHLETVRPVLRPRVLYGFHGRDGNLREIPFAELGPCSWSAARET